MNTSLGHTTDVVSIADQLKKYKSRFAADLAEEVSVIPSYKVLIEIICETRSLLVSLITEKRSEQSRKTGCSLCACISK